ncbi:MAG TPA: ABC transporter permease [Symbiobacteriaceae bacterium]
MLRDHFGSTVVLTTHYITEGLPYLDFMAPGVLAQSTLFVAIFYGISLIWERDLGILHKYMVSPAPRAALVLGKALSAGVRALAQAVVVCVALRGWMIEGGTSLFGPGRDLAFLLAALVVLVALAARLCPRAVA